MHKLVNICGSCKGCGLSLVRNSRKNAVSKTSQTKGVKVVELTLRIVLGLLTLICLAGGLNLLIKGTGSFLPSTVPPQRVLDNLFRFLSGIYFGLGFLMAWIIFHFSDFTELIYFIGIVVICSGLGRLYSRIKIGSAGKYFEFIMVFEIALGAVIVVLQYFRFG